MPEHAAPPVAPAPGAARTGGLLRDTTLYFIGNLAFKAIGFLMIPFYAHFLSPAQSGVLNLVELATQVVAIAFGLQTIGTSLARITHDQPTEAARREAVSTAMLITILLAAGIAALCCVFAAPIAAAISLAGQAPLLRLAFCAMFFGLLVEVALVHERMSGRAHWFLGYSLASLAVTLLFNILLIGVFRLGVEGFLISKLVAGTIGSAFLLLRLFRETGVVWRMAVARAMAKFGGPLVVSGLAYFAVHFSDRLFLAPVSKADVGIYSMAYNFAFLLSVLIGDSFNKSWGVSLYGLATGDGWQKKFVSIGRWLIFVLGTGAIGISLFGRDTLTLMVPQSYYPPLFMLPVLVFGYFLREVGDFFNSMLLVGIGSGLVGRIAIVGAVLNLALNAFLIPVYGIWGAAWATFATWAIYCALCWVFAARVHGVKMSPWPLALMLGLSTLVLSARAEISPGGHLLSLAADSLCFALFLLAACTVYLQASERREIWHLAHRLVRL